ncbi:F0F1 ATP synthase subunit B [Oenococcus alcoholitolerans]|uniref:F0F1 ATP synthase subunit B n=1 Tax=Oenococcus alcoholitolerans TaxID=931074 RepID=UPI003F7295D0
MLTTIAIVIPQGSAILVLLTFILLMYLVKKIAWGPITKMMDERANQIDSDLDSAAKSREEAQKLHSTADKLLKDSKAQAADIVEKARKSSEDEAKKIVDMARAHADSVSRQAQADARQAKADALDSAKDQIADISVSIASQLLQTEIDADKHRELINDFIDQLETEEKSGSDKENS